ncbi:hypothetical protein [Microbacterium hominis]|uniref:CU044_5270 family protein n=1 Tax=Microbacterium hominis TaxID=162426 RepID=A0A7D4UBT1_9MICO|nr:hypothetical protein [Microbacterium hominis]QKJ19923.1 hypothetical protein HQM25_11525 [Microbacterium hominis]
MGHDPDALSDDRLDSLLRQLDPLSGVNADEPLNDRDRAVLLRIMAQPRKKTLVGAAPAPRPAPRNMALVLTMAVTAMVAMIAIVLVWPPVAPSAIALTPPPLKVSSTSQTVGEVASMAQRLLAGRAGQPAAERRVSSVGWYLQMDHPASGETIAVIVPQVIELAWNEDGSGREVTTAGIPYLADGTRLEDSTRGPEPGRVLHDITYAAGGFGTPVQQVPGESATEVKDFLAAYWNPVATSGTASDIITAIGNAFSSWTLTNQQHAHILDMLSRAPGAYIAGTALDRADREVTVIAADSTHNPDYQLLLLVSNETGRIVGTESVRLTPSGELPAGSVTSYTLWDTH